MVGYLLQRDMPGPKQLEQFMTNWTVTVSGTPRPPLAAGLTWSPAASPTSLALEGGVSNLGGGVSATWTVKLFNIRDALSGK